MARRATSWMFPGAIDQRDTYVDGIYEERSTACNAPATVTKFYKAFGRIIAQRANSTLTYFLADHLGSTLGTVDAATGAVSRMQYYPFGTQRGGNAPPTDKAYTGQQQESPVVSTIGAYYYHARFYSTKLAHFMSADSLTVDGLNRYAYVRNNPVNQNDPTGNCIFDDEGPRGCGFDAHAYDVSDYARKAYQGVDPFTELRRLNDAIALIALANSGIPAEVWLQAATPGTDAADYLRDLEGNATACHACDEVLAGAVSTIATLGVGTVAEEVAARGVGDILADEAGSVGGGSSRALARNLERAEFHRFEGEEAHHIVAVTDARAASARRAIERVGIDVDSADNGVFLPRAFHRSATATDAYHRAVSDALSEVGNREEALTVLRSIRSWLIGGD